MIVSNNNYCNKIEQSYTAVRRAAKVKAYSFQRHILIFTMFLPLSMFLPNKYCVRYDKKCKNANKIFARNKSKAIQSKAIQLLKTSQDCAPKIMIKLDQHNAVEFLII